jgi:hypothetical protein
MRSRNACSFISKNENGLGTRTLVPSTVERRGHGTGEQLDRDPPPFGATYEAKELRTNRLITQRVERLPEMSHVSVVDDDLRREEHVEIRRGTWNRPRGAVDVRAFLGRQ